MNGCSKTLENVNGGKNKIFKALFVVAMLLPFAFKSIWAYYYWIAVVAVYLGYLAWRWKP